LGQQFRWEGLLQSKTDHKEINWEVVKMTLWNKVSPASPYLDDVLSGAGEGPVRVGSARSVNSLQIFAVGVFVRRCNLAVFGCGGFGLFLRSVLRQVPVKFRFLQSAGFVMKDCKPMLLGVLPQPMFFQRLLDVVVSSG
jgi:hypothetical protein